MGAFILFLNYLETYEVIKMVMRDIDVLGSKSTDSIVLFEKERPISRLKVQDYVDMQEIMEEMAILAGRTPEEVRKIESRCFKILNKFIPDLSRKEYDEMNLAQKMAVLNFIDELFLLDQGITEEQVKEIKKLMEMKRMNILAQSIGNEEDTS